MDTATLLGSFRERGFVSAGRRGLSPEEANELGACTREVLAGMSHDHPHYLPLESGSGGYRAVPEHSARICELLEKVVSDPAVQAVLEGMLGPDYKIWQIDFRRSVPGDRGLELHQDGKGQLNLAILLSDTPGKEGSTVFLPGSHRAPYRLKATGVRAPPAVVNTLRGIFAANEGKAGDIAFFLNRTWHARFANRSDQPNEAILLAFFPVGGRMSYAPPYTTWSPELLRSLEGTRLGALLDTSRGTRDMGDHLVEVTGSDVQKADGPSYAIAIETGSAAAEYARDRRLRSAVALLRVAGAAVGLARAVLKPLRRSRGAA